MVGESGCGKSVTAMTVLKLVPMPPGRDRRRTGVVWQGRETSFHLPPEEVRKIRAKEIAIENFQEADRPH